MPNGIYSAAAAMAAQQTQLDALANDVANADTTGYKSERVGFTDLLYQSENGVDVGSGAAAVDLGRSFSQGAPTASDNPLALAISGPGFFQVKRADGTTALTRDGNFTLDAQGSLVTPTGEQLVPPIRVPKGTQPTDVAIASNGAVTVKGKTVGAIKLVDVPAPGALLSVGSGMFAVTQGSGSPGPAAGASLSQHELEGSNVDLATAMTQMIGAQRAYALESRVIQTQDQLRAIANNLRA